MIDQDFFVGLIQDPENTELAIPSKYFQPTDDDFKDFSESAFNFSHGKFTMSRGNLICTSIPNENKWLQEKRGVQDGKFDEVAELLIIK